MDLKHKRLGSYYRALSDWKDTVRNSEKELDTTWPRMLVLSELLSNYVIVIHFKIK